MEVYEGQGAGDGGMTNSYTPGRLEREVLSLFYTQ